MKTSEGYEYSIKQYEKLSERVASALEGLNKSMDLINDQNILHTTALTNNTKSIENLLKVISSLGFIIVVGLLVLAGAEKIIEIF